MLRLEVKLTRSVCVQKKFSKFAPITRKDFKKAIYITECDR